MDGNKLDFNNCSHFEKIGIYDLFFLFWNPNVLNRQKV